jgi:hypothetical protein
LMVPFDAEEESPAEKRRTPNPSPWLKARQ